MSVKSTITLGRARAEAKFLALHVLAQRQERGEKFRRKVENLTTRDVVLPWRSADRLSGLSLEDMFEVALAVDLGRRASSMNVAAISRLTDLDDDRRLEDELERLNDRCSEGGEGFENYSIDRSLDQD